MQAVVFHEFGKSDVLRLEELSDPVAGPGEVVVDVTASALNHLDIDVREGVSRFPVELPHVLGVEPVGRIAALGDGVVDWKIGDRVAVYLIAVCGACTYCRSGRESLCTAPSWFVSMGSGGAYAEKVLCKETQLIRIPDGVSDVEAAASHIAFGTAWHMLLTRARLRPMSPLEQHRERQPDHHDHGRPGDDVERRGVDVLAHQLAVVGQQQHEDQHERQHDAVDDLRQHHDVRQREVAERAARRRR